MKPRHQRIAEKKAYVKAERYLSRKNYKCLYRGCGEMAIRSHSQQKNGPLKAISENGKVYRLDDNFQRSFNIETDSLEYRFALKGVGESSTFPGFCNKHEAMFSIFENKALEVGNEEQACMLFYRTFCYEKARKRREYERWRMIQDELSDQWGGVVTQGISPQIEEINNHIKYTCDYNINASLDMMVKGDYVSLNSRWLKLEHNVNVSCSSTINLHLDDYLRYAIKNPGAPLPTFTYNLIPGDSSTFIVVSWLSEFDVCAEWLAKLFDEKHDLEYHVNRFSFCDSEDVCINPSLWLEVEDTEGFIDNMRHVFQRGELSQEKVARLIRLQKEKCSS